MTEIQATNRFTYSLYIFIFGYALAFIISGVLVNHVIEHYGLVGAEQGYMNSVINMGNTIAIFLTIAMHIKVKKTTMIVISGLLMTSMLLATGLSGSFYMLLIVSLILGFGLGWGDSYINSCIIDANPKDSLKKQGFLHGFYGIGALLTPVVAAALLTSISWQGIYLIFSPIVMLTVVFYIVTLHTTKKYIAISNTEPPKFSKVDILDYLRQKKNVLLLAACLTYSIMQFGLFTWLVRYMSVQHGMEELGMVGITVMWIFTTISRFIAPRLKLDSMALHAFGSLAAGIFLLVGVVLNNPWVMLAMVGLASLTTGFSVMVLINKSAVSNKINSLLSTSAILLMTRVAGMVTPPFLGFISIYSMQGSMIVLVIASIISGILAFAFLRTKE